MNITTVSFGAGDTIAISEGNLWQYDYGQILKIQGLDLPAVYAVDFANIGDTDSVPMIGDENGVQIPDSLLATGKSIYAYVWLHTGDDDGETEYKICVPVFPRPERSDEEPTPEQQTVIDQLITALNNGVAHVDEVAESLEESPFAPGTGEYSAVLINSSHPNTASGDSGAVAIGENCEASGACSFAAGNKTVASGVGAFSVGQLNKSTQKPTTATGDSSFASGLGVTASGKNAQAFGQATSATATAATSFGLRSAASGPVSQAFGQETKAEAAMSTAFGAGTDATGRASFVIGQYNAPDENPIDTTHGSDARKYVAIVGNGTADNARSNAATLDWDGNAVLSGKLTVGADPTENMDAATKQYVDQHGGVSTFAPSDGENSAVLINESDPNVVTGANSLAVGSGNNVGANNSAAFGFKNTIDPNSGGRNFVFGDYNEATLTSWMGFAAGGHNKLGATICNALGYGLIANCSFGTVLGGYNIAQELDDPDRTEYLVIVGNGANSRNRSNAATLDREGNLWVSGKMTAGDDPTSDMDVATKKYVDDAVARIENMLNSITIENGVLTFRRGVNE